MIRCVLHFIIIWASALVCGIGTCLYAFGAILLLLASKVHPTSLYGNCWTYAVPLWLRFGGHLAIRASDDNKFLWVFPVLHVKYIGELPRRGLHMRQYIPAPELRKKTKVWPWYTVYYKGEIHRVDSPHDAAAGWEEAAKIEGVRNIQ